MRSLQKYEHDDVIAELGGSSFMTKRGYVIEGNYQIGDHVMLVYDELGKRYLPVYKRRKEIAGKTGKPEIEKEKPPVKCQCRIVLDQTDELNSGDASVAAAEVIFTNCGEISLEDASIDWELITDGTFNDCGQSVGGSIETQIIEAQPYNLYWRVWATGADYGFVTVRAKFDHEGAICTVDKVVKVTACLCTAELTVDPEYVGNEEVVTAILEVDYSNCSQVAIDSVRVTWDVRVVDCEGECDYEITEQDETHLKFIPTITGWGVFEVQATVDGDCDIPYCTETALVYVGCTCDVVITIPQNPIATSYVYEARVKGYYYNCTEPEKQGSPLTYEFHDCEGNGPICDVEIVSSELISEDPPEFKIEFAIDPLAGSGTVYLRGRMGSPGNPPYCEQDALIEFDCCLKGIDDRKVIVYVEPDDHNIAPGGERTLWVDPLEDGGCPPFTWDLNGPGTLEVSDDTTTAFYEAPEEKELVGCQAKGNIKVTDACGTYDDWGFSVTVVYPGVAAYRVHRCQDTGIYGSWCTRPCGGGGWNFHMIHGWVWYLELYNCAGDYMGIDWGNNYGPCITHDIELGDCCDWMGSGDHKMCTGSCETGCGPVDIPGWQFANGHHCGDLEDLRTQQMIDAHCCPYELNQ